MDSARRAFAAVQQREQADSRVDPDCYSFLLAHDGATDQAIVLLHGITSSPIQLRRLAENFFARDYNVLVPRMPRHGYHDRLTTDQGGLGHDEMLAWTSAAIAIGRGLGRHLTLAGLSVSGTLAAWAYANRSDVDLAVPIAPAFAPAGVPLVVVPVLSRLALRLPNLFVWWDLRTRGRAINPAGYPRFATHPLAAAFLIGMDVYRLAAHERPRGGGVVVVSNPHDMAVSNRATRAVVRRWRQQAGGRVKHTELGPSIGRLHDVIGPYQPGARPDYVYPLLLDSITRASA